MFIRIGKLILNPANVVSIVSFDRGVVVQMNVPLQAGAKPDETTGSLLSFEGLEAEAIQRYFSEPDVTRTIG